jgi:hypothetical protein
MLFIDSSESSHWWSTVDTALSALQENSIDASVTDCPAIDGAGKEN